MSDLRKTSGRVPLHWASALYFAAIAGLLAFHLQLAAPVARLLFSAFPGIRAEAVTLIANALYYLPFLFLPAALAARRFDAGESMRLKGLSPLCAAAVALLAFAGFLLAYDVSSLWSILLDSLGLTLQDTGLQPSSSTAGLMIQAVSIGALPGICEELLCRGAILSAWEEKGTRRAILVSAALFTALHGTIAGAPSQFLLGVLLGWVVVACDSLFAGMVFHTAYNSIALLVSARLSRLPAPPEEEAALLSQSLFALYGGAAGVFGILIEALLLIWMMRILLKIALRHRELAQGWKPLPDRPVEMRPPAKILLALGLAVSALFYWIDLRGMLGGGL